jgi:glucosamine kinase
MMQSRAGRLTFCVDAGGTHCRGRLYDPSGAVLAEGDAGPCNPSTDPAQAVASLTALWQACAAKAGRDAADVADVGFAIGGAGLYARGARQQFLASIPRFARAEVMSDGYAALIGAGGGAPCALIIAGTGVVAHRLYPDRRSIQRDGWGWIAGDRGSGAWIGQRALRHALASVDGLVPRDALADAVLAVLREDDRRLGGWLIGMGPSRLGALAPLVLAAADAGNATAQRILAHAVAHLAALAGTLDVTAADALYLAGGLAATFRAPLAAALGRAIEVPAADAITGCRLVANGAAPPETFFDALGFGGDAD